MYRISKGNPGFLIELCQLKKSGKIRGIGELKKKFSALTEKGELTFNLVLNEKLDSLSIETKRLLYWLSGLVLSDLQFNVDLLDKLPVKLNLDQCLEELESTGIAKKEGDRLKLDFNHALVFWERQTTKSKKLINEWLAQCYESKQPLQVNKVALHYWLTCLLYTSPSPRD